MRRNEYKLLVFDWDGTLMDSEARIVQSFEAAIAEVGLPERPRSALRGIIGLGMTEALQHLFPDEDAGAHAALVERYRHHFVVANPTPTPLFEGVLPMLAALEEAGYFLAVATGKARRGLDRVLRETGLETVFHYTRCADECHSKPHPQMLLEIMERTGVEPSETLMIGDTEFDLLMARNAGTHALGVTYGVHEPERLFACGPLGCVDSVPELHDWLLDGRARSVPPVTA